MKPIKLIFLLLLALPLLTNCGDDKKSATTPVKPTGEHCRINPNDPICGRTTGVYNGQKVVLGEMEVLDIDLYEMIIKASPRGCNIPSIYYDGSVESVIGSIASSAANRCTRWKTEPARIELYYQNNNQVTVSIYARNDYNGSPAHLYTFHSVIEPRNQNNDFFINLESHHQGRNGMSLYGEGDPNQPNFSLSLTVDGEIVGTASMREYNQFNQYNQYR